MAKKKYRKVGEITADEFYAQLGTTPRFQKDIFVSLGGDPTDHDYARLSFLTQELGQRGTAIHTSRGKGVWIDLPS